MKKQILASLTILLVMFALVVKLNLVPFASVKALSWSPTIVSSYTSGVTGTGLTHLYPTSNGSYSAFGAEFSLTDSGVWIITNVSFELARLYGTGYPSGYAHAVLYAASGGAPSGSPLATSIGWQVSQETSFFAWYEIMFNATNEHWMYGEKNYFIVFQAPTSGTVSTNNQINYRYSSAPGYTSVQYYNSQYNTASNTAVNYEVYAVQITEPSGSWSGEQLVDNYGIGTTLNQGQAAFLYATMAEHWVAQPWICCGYGSSFYSANPFYVSHVTFCLFRTNGTTNGPLTVTANITADIYASGSQTYSGLPTGVPIDISNPANVSTITAAAYQIGGYYYGPFQLVNFTFQAPVCLPEGAYYTIALQVAENGFIYSDNQILYGQIGIFVWNSTNSECMPFLIPNAQTGYNWGLDSPAYDCITAMAIYGYYSKRARSWELSQDFLLLMILVIVAAVAFVLWRVRYKKEG